MLASLSLTGVGGIAVVDTLVSVEARPTSRLSCLLLLLLLLWQKHCACVRPALVPVAVVAAVAAVAILGISHCSHLSRAGWLRKVHSLHDHCGPSFAVMEDEEASTEVGGGGAGRRLGAGTRDGIKQ